MIPPIAFFGCRLTYFIRAFWNVWRGRCEQGERDPPNTAEINRESWPMSTAVSVRRWEEEEDDEEEEGVGVLSL